MTTIAWTFLAVGAGVALAGLAYGFFAKRKLEDTKAELARERLVSAHLQRLRFKEKNRRLSGKALASHIDGALDKLRRVGDQLDSSS